MTQHNPLDALTETFNKHTAPVKGKPGISTVAVQNKSAAINAAVDAVGRTGNALAINLVKPHLPMMVRGYADHPLFAITMANLVNYAVQQTGLGGERGRVAANAMIQSAYVDLGRKFDINKMVETLLNKLPGDKLDELLASARKDADAE